ncbi:hypothetical protein [Stieleria varia]|uniref:hypothetical protein n=1 Tax=Stieleria varia TaxID=2528005 RepID=UPI003CC7AFEC
MANADHCGKDHCGKDHCGKDHCGKDHCGKDHCGKDHCGKETCQPTSSVAYSVMVTGAMRQGDCTAIYRLKTTFSM